MTLGYVFLISYVQWHISSQKSELFVKRETRPFLIPGGYLMPFATDCLSHGRCDFLLANGNHSKLRLLERFSPVIRDPWEEIPLFFLDPPPDLLCEKITP